MKRYYILCDNCHLHHAAIIQLLHVTLSTTCDQIGCLDVSATPSLIMQQLSKFSPDFIITLDLAGFEFKTLTGECFLNTLPCKILNIIWGDKSKYEPYLSKKLSLSMLFYDVTGHDNNLPSKYTNMRYYYPTSKEIVTNQYKRSNNTVLEVMQEIWTHFKSETLL